MLARHSPHHLLAFAVDISQIGLDKRTMLTANRMAIADFDLDDDDDEGNDGNRKDGDNGAANGAYHLDYRGSVYSKVRCWFQKGGRR